LFFFLYKTSGVLHIRKQVIIPLFIKIHRSRAIHRHKYNESTKMKRLLDDTISQKDKPVRLYKPPTLEEMEATGEKYFSFPNKCSTNIMIHLGHYFLHLLILVNKSFYNLLNRSLKNGPFIFAYCNKMIDYGLLKGLYEGDEAILNKHKAICHRGNIPLCSMIMCSTEWPDIDPRKLHLLSLVNPDTCNTFAFRKFWCGNITGFDYILFNNELLRDDPSFEHTDLTSYGVLNWREPASEDEDELPNAFSYRVHFCFDFSLEEHGYLETAVVYLERTRMCINILPKFDVLPESLCSTNPPTDLLKIRVDQISVMLTIGECKNLTYL
jgi:hypothetical protein